MKEIAFEGIDNVGKTSIATCIANKLRSEGNVVHIASPFHEAAVDGNELYTLFTTSPNTAATAIKLLREALSRSRKSAADIHANYLLFDRHWMTAKIMAPEQTLESDGSIPTTVLLVSGDRDLHDMTDNEPWSTVEELDRYQHLYKKLAACNFKHILGIYTVEDPPVDIDIVAETILWDERILR